MRLSEAIRLGAMLRPQGFGALFNNRRRWRFFGKHVEESCALGAAFEAGGVGHRMTVADGKTLPFRGTAATKAGTQIAVLDTPPEWEVTLFREEACPQCGVQEPLKRLIPHLNDRHRWTREEIAGFVERLEVDLVGWWEARRAECLVNDGWYQNALDVANLELRQKLAPQLRAFYPTYSWCQHCGWPWPIVESHSLDFDAARSCFPICKWCYRYLRSNGLREMYVACFRALFDKWEAESPEVWRQIVTAIDREWPTPRGILERSAQSTG